MTFDPSYPDPSVFRRRAIHHSASQLPIPRPSEHSRAPSSRYARPNVLSNHQAPNSPHWNSASRKRLLVGGERSGPIRANSSSKVTNLICRLPLLTFFQFTRDFSSWKPVAVMGTALPWVSFNDRRRTPRGAPWSRITFIFQGPSPNYNPLTFWWRQCPYNVRTISRSKTIHMVLKECTKRIHLWRVVVPVHQESYDPTRRQAREGCEARERSATPPRTQPLVAQQRRSYH
jgi:hypothetical protein